MKKLSFSKKIIKSYLPDEIYTDGTRFNGFVLGSHGYDLRCIKLGKEYKLVTQLNSDVVMELKKHFEVLYVGHVWNIFYQYKVLPKNYQDVSEKDTYNTNFK